jgi:hypothetical protein
VGYNLQKQQKTNNNKNKNKKTNETLAHHSRTDFGGQAIKAQR